MTSKVSAREKQVLAMPLVGVVGQGRTWAGTLDWVRAAARASWMSL